MKIALAVFGALAAAVIAWSSLPLSRKAPLRTP